MLPHFLDLAAHHRTYAGYQDQDYDWVMSLYRPGCWSTECMLLEKKEKKENIVLMLFWACFCCNCHWLFLLSISQSSSTLGFRRVVMEEVLQWLHTNNPFRSVQCHGLDWRSFFFFLFPLDTNTGLLYVIAPTIFNHYIVVLYIFDKNDLSYWDYYCQTVIVNWEG